MTDPRLRQFALTGGRARSETDLPLEVPISAVSAWQAPGRTLPEYREILERCAYPQTVVDLSSALEVPVGVVRVFVLDLAEAGAVTIHWDGNADIAPHRDVALLEETLRGIGNL